jgi:hypothetical protein
MPAAVSLWPGSHGAVEKDGKRLNFLATEHPTKNANQQLRSANRESRDQHLFHPARLLRYSY